jgi:hypothetical protein
VRWDRLPMLMAAVNIAVFRDRLRAHNLHHTGYGVPSADKWKPGYERWRSACPRPARRCSNQVPA